MKALAKFLSVLIAVVALCSLFLHYEKRKVAYMRLAAVRIVDPSCQSEHVYSSGILRENTHVLRTKRGCLFGEAAKPEENLDPLLPGDESSEVRLGILE